MDRAPADRPDTAGMVIAGVLLLLAVGDLLGHEHAAARADLRDGAEGDALCDRARASPFWPPAISFWPGAATFPPREDIDPQAIVLILGGLAALIAIIGLGGGFIAATTILFVDHRAAFGRRAFHIDLAIGLVLAVAIYLLFDKLLTLSLPAGPLERLILRPGHGRPQLLDPGPRCRDAAHQPAVRADRRAARHCRRRAARHRPGADRGPASSRSPSSSIPPARSSCSPASTTAACTAARPPPS